MILFLFFHDTKGDAIIQESPKWIEIALDLFGKYIMKIKNNDMILSARPTIESLINCIKEIMIQSNKDYNLSHKSIEATKVLLKETKSVWLANGYNSDDESSTFATDVDFVIEHLNKVN